MNYLNVNGKSLLNNRAIVFGMPTRKREGTNTKSLEMLQRKRLPRRWLSSSNQPTRKIGQVYSRNSCQSTSYSDFAHLTALRKTGKPSPYFFAPSLVHCGG